MAYDLARRRVVLIGGLGDAGALNDTWEFDGVAWSRRANFDGGGIEGHAIVYDEARQLTVLVGGAANISSGPFNQHAWLWDGGTWTQSLPLSLGPSTRVQLPMAWDAVRERVVLTHGGGCGGSCTDTWGLDATGWLQRSTTNSPPGTVYQHFSFDRARGKFTLYTVAAALGQTYHYDGNTTWTIPAFENPSPAREVWAQVYDSHRRRTVAFGGISVTSSVALAETVELTSYGVGWEVVSTVDSPPARAGHSMVYADHLGRIVLFGGQNGGTWFGDTWVYGGPLP